MFCVVIGLILINIVLFSGSKIVRCENSNNEVNIESKSAIIMEGATGKIIYKKNPNEMC